MGNTHFYVVIPVYKAEKYLAECLDSVLNQTYPDFEIIAVDDGSPDGSGKICDAYAARDNRIHVIHKENGGAFSARAAGIAMAMELGSGSGYLMSLDADDTYKPHTLEIVNRNIRSTDADIVFFRRDTDYGDRIVLADSHPAKYSGIIEDRHEFYSAVFCNPGFNPLWTKAIRLSLFTPEDLVEPFKIRLGEDLLQSIPIYKKCKRALFLEDSLYIYRIVNTSATNNVTFENYINISPLDQQIWDIMEQECAGAPEIRDLFVTTCKQRLFKKIWDISRIWTPMKNRYALYDEIRQDEYCSNLLTMAEPREFLLTWIRKRKYFLLCLVGTICKLLGNLRRCLRRIRRHS